MTSEALASGMQVLSVSVVGYREQKCGFLLAAVENSISAQASGASIFILIASSSFSSRGNLAVSQPSAI